MGEMKGKDYAYEEVQEAVNHERTKRAVVKRDLDAATEELAKYKAVLKLINRDMDAPEYNGAVKLFRARLEAAGIPESEESHE